MKLTLKSTTLFLILGLAAFGCATERQAPAVEPPTISAAPGGGSACSKDTDCKGDRVCESGTCVDAKK